MKGPLCIVIMGPKAAGKSWVAQVLSSKLGIFHVDADVLVLRLIERGQVPDPDNGWLASIEDSVMTALEQHPAVSVEATGAWPSDWVLIDRLRHRGITVRTVWVNATLNQSLTRLHKRTVCKVPTTDTEARWHYEEASRWAAQTIFDLIVDATGTPDETLVASKAAVLMTG